MDSERPPKTEREQVAFWQDRISVARKTLDDWATESGANRFIEEYNGKFMLFFNGLRGKIPVPPINDVFSYVQSDLAFTYNRDPYISVNPKAGTILGAKLWEVLLNYDWRELDLKDEIESEIIDKDLVGFAWHKVGYALETEGSPDKLKAAHERFYSLRVNWRDIVYNISAKNPPKDCIWMAQRIVRPVADVRKKFKVAASEKLEGIQTPELDKDSYNNAYYKDDVKVAILWEIWDAESRMIYLVCEGITDKFLIEPKPWPDYLDEFPFLMYWDYAAPGKMRPMSAIAPWEHQLLEKMVLLASAVNHSKRWNRQMILQQGSMSPEAMDQYERGDDGAIIVNSGTGKLDENMKIVDYGQLPTDFYLIMDRINSIQNNTSGMPEFITGGVTKTNTRTIGELQEIKAGAKGRIDRRVDRLETHLENIANQMMAHRKANFDFEETVKITGDAPEEVIKALGDLYDPATNSVRISPEDIQGEYDVEIKAGSTLPLDKQTKMKILELVLQTLGAVQSQGISPLMNAVVTEILDGFDIKSLKLAWTQEQLAATEKAQMESQEVSSDSLKAKTQADKNLAQAEKIRTDTDLDMATTIADLVGANGASGETPNGL